MQHLYFLKFHGFRTIIRPRFLNVEGYQYLVFKYFPLNILTLMIIVSFAGSLYLALAVASVLAIVLAFAIDISRLLV